MQEKEMLNDGKEKYENCELHRNLQIIFEKALRNPLAK